jgi:polar amino acid transport system substrate-binding protein
MGAASLDFCLPKSVLGICLAVSVVSAFAAEQRDTETLRVAVYDVPPNGYVDVDGAISGISVDLWCRVAEQMEWPFRLIPVSDMESILSGLEQGRFDAAIGAITRRKGRCASTSPIQGSRSPCEMRRSGLGLFALRVFAAPSCRGPVSKRVPARMTQHVRVCFK